MFKKISLFSHITAFFSSSCLFIEFLKFSESSIFREIHFIFSFFSKSKLSIFLIQNSKISFKSLGKYSEKTIFSLKKSIFFSSSKIYHIISSILEILFFIFRFSSVDFCTLNLILLNLS